MNDHNTMQLLSTAASPHIRSDGAVPGIMRDVLISLIPAFVASIVFFGYRALMVTALCSGVAVATEWCILRFIIRKNAIVWDYSAIVTGVLLAFSLPPHIPLWLPILGSVFAIGIVKWTFGGLGNNIVNPALAGRAFLMLSYPSALLAFSPTAFGSMSGLSHPPDAYAAATPLAALKTAVQSGTFEVLDFQESFFNLLIGNVGGCIGETSVLALIGGALFLLYKQIIGFTVPLSFIGTVYLFFWIFNGVTMDLFSFDALFVPLYQTVSGGLILGALFMANDMVTSPMTTKGRLFYGIGCGFITFIIRKYGGYMEGVCFAILIMNCTVPLIDRYIYPSTLAGAGRK